MIALYNGLVRFDCLANIYTFAALAESHTAIYNDINIFYLNVHYLSTEG